MENGQLSLTYDKLVALSEGLRVDIAALFDPEPRFDPMPPGVTARRSITRQGQGLRVETPNYDYRYLCTDLAKKAMVPILITIRARSLVQLRLVQHPLGRGVHLRPARRGRGPHRVLRADSTQAGEAMYIDSTMRHAFLTTGKRSALMLDVCHSAEAGHFRTLVELASAAREPGNADADPFTSAAGGP